MELATSFLPLLQVFAAGNDQPDVSESGDLGDGLGVRPQADDLWHGPRQWIGVGRTD